MKIILKHLCAELWSTHTATVVLQNGKHDGICMWEPCTRKLILHFFNRVSCCYVAFPGVQNTHV